MKTSVSMYSLHKYTVNENLDVFGFIQYASSIGLEGVELLDMYWKDVEQELPKVKLLLAEKNLIVSAYDISNNFVKTSEDERKMEIQKVYDGIDIAKNLNTNVVRIFSGDVTENVSFEQGKSWIIECLKECASYAEKQGIILAIENHGYFAGRSEQVIELIETVGSTHVRSTLDTGNFLLVDEEPSHAVAALKKYVAHVHFKDFVNVGTDYEGHSFLSLSGGKFLGTIAGEGKVDLHHAIHELKSVNYEGWLSVEYEGTDDPKVGTEKSVDNLKQILQAL
ncbi:sugar phosphate isomerase/epimerase family protein [Fredinandcohnia sp. QZ13]|uniref:sugar phosphate isomerase/epimerase family protein n=1 Tax=Fredinandcohnia sp. QZ13 TaxID=3073144 RepID=UPI00285316A3|nr:sugar phosphate isomerase/epimerase family protein [Fredinandcohnia sp. QZ13]MDR4886718.1 sugar phosphate isomerase/epimerase family protein [Fredinandcohnia sp. QZ13]